MRAFFIISHILCFSILSQTAPTAPEVPGLASALASITSGACATSTPLSTTSAVSTTVSANATSTAASSTTVSPQPTSTPLDPATAQDIATIHVRRLSNIVGSLTNASSIPSWLSTLQANGQWPDLDYTTGCPAQRANWPAELTRISTMAGGWNGGFPGAEPYVKDPTLRSNISLAMGYWSTNDFTNPACVDSGGTAACPCGTPGLWNTNWSSNIIGTPALVSTTCLLLNDSLIQTELEHCTTITGRAYGTFDHSIHGAGFLTGANTLDVAKIGIHQALLTLNISMLTDACRRGHAELAITTPLRADGIRPDGSFGQEYYTMGTTERTTLTMSSTWKSRPEGPGITNALATLCDVDRWMIYRNVLTGVLHWDFSVLGRFISFPTADFTQATGSIQLSLTKINALGQEWGSDTLENFSTLSTTGTTANAGELTGNRMFYNNDYMDIAAAIDWNLVPGTTVDYGATPLNYAQSQFVGIENFVGGASDGQVGVAAMRRYTNPLTHQLSWQKMWFFLADDVQLVMVANVSSASNATIAFVLDQRRHAGAVVLDSTTVATAASDSFAPDDVRAQSLWHGDVGYAFSAPANSFSLALQVCFKSERNKGIGQ
ncbi:chondroitin AC/alginate lyase [Mycena rosella]|uniref:Chondroitin AC/alginate lyase n=1 Tax=Mycena rosella TaxID=1033263 RepID=A0AAD7DC49_MYCRO|nr:chondroitin AC/alginate lyase [Mycena rosella]